MRGFAFRSAARVIFGLLAGSARASAQSSAEHRVEFEAEQVEVELEPQRGPLELRGNVVVRSERFQLTSEAMTLSRSPRGVHVEGGGRLSFCRCKDPPVTLGFSAADLAPPTDVLLEDATVRVAGIPVFYTPYLWLRAPDRLGLVPPLVAWRGEEGLLVGSGVHVPLGRGAASAVDVRAAGYVRGGARVDVRAEAEGARVEAAWDHFGATALELRSTFASSAAHGATLAGRADVLRGERALAAPFSLETVTQSADRFKVAVGTARSAVLGLSLESTAERGAALDEAGQLGPALELGLGAALGRRARFGVGVDTHAARSVDGALSQSSVASELSAAVAMGPLLAELRLRERGEATTRPAGHALRGAAELRSRVALPLARRYATLVHRVEPWLEAATGGALHDELGGVELLSSDRGRLETHSVAAVAGVDTALGARRSAADARLAAGVVGTPRDPRIALAGRTRLDFGAARASVATRALPDAGAVDTSASAGLGTATSLRIAAFLEGALGDAGAAHRLIGDDWLLPHGGFFDRRGWTAGGRLGVPWGYGFETELAANFDADDERFLAGTAALGYRHPCRCLELGVWGGRRVGREGFDLALSVDVVP